MATDDHDLDYDNIISQNILIKKDETEDKEATVEVLTKQSDDYEQQYNRQAEIYNMDENNVYQGSDEDEEESSNSDSEYEVKLRPKKQKIAISDEDDVESSDSDWNEPKKSRPSKNKNAFECEICGKGWDTKRGLLMHRRSHNKQNNRKKNSENTVKTEEEDL